MLGTRCLEIQVSNVYILRTSASDSAQVVHDVGVRWLLQYLMVYLLMLLC